MAICYGHFLSQAPVVNPQLAHEAEIGVDLWSGLFNQVVGHLPVQ